MTAPAEFVASFRFGYGLRPGEAPPRDAGDLLSQIAHGAASQPDLAGAPIDERAALYESWRVAREEFRKGGTKAEMRRIDKRIWRMHRDDLDRRIAAPILSPYGFYERLAWFWADHFAVGSHNRHMRSMSARFEPDAIRPHIGGYFRDMLRASSLHPSMLLFLSQISSIGPNSPAGLKNGRGLNENLAREIIELHTLGVGADYTQADVRQFAELLTGLTFRRQTAEQIFQPSRAEPGSETVLGVSYGGDPAELEDILQALDDLAAHPATARHVAWKLSRHFVDDEPSDALVQHVAAAYRRSDGRLPAVYEALLEHPETWSSFGRKVRQPFDYIVATMRAVGAGEADLGRHGEDAREERRFRHHLAAMGQTPITPDGPDGWPEEADAWITPLGLSARLQWASLVAHDVERRFDPRRFVEATLGPLASEETRFAVTRAAERWEGLAFVFASPEFNRR